MHEWQSVMSFNRESPNMRPRYKTRASGWRTLMLCATLIVSSPLLPAAAQGADVKDTSVLPAASAVQVSPLAAEAGATAAQGDKKGAHKQRARGARAERESVKARTNRPARPPRKKSAYDLLMESLHEKAPEALCEEARKAPIRNLVFRIDGKEETTYALRPSSALGGFDDEEQLAVARQAFGSWEGGPTPHTRTLDLIYAAMLHFDVPYVHLISGIRKDRGGSRHSHGLAADVVLPGVDDEELAAFFRAQGFVGVGTYPRSGFVHIDTRDHSYFWIDRSSPGRRGKVVAVRGEEAKTVDEAALVRGNTGFVNPPRLQRALSVRASRRRAAREVRQQREAVQQMAAGQPQSSELSAH